MSLKRFSSKIEIGCDEAGRGSLSGPVVASAVILPKNFKNSDLDDSKKLSLRKREELSKIILEKAISCEIGIVDEKKIDEINILNASILAMHKALKKTQNTFEVILVEFLYSLGDEVWLAKKPKAYLSSRSCLLNLYMII